MDEATIVKIGGSIITDKAGGRAVVKEALLYQLARELCTHNGSLVLLYGGGAFGHPIAQRYRLPGRILDKNSLEGLRKTSASMHLLGDAVSQAFSRRGLRVVPFQTSALFHEEKGELVCGNSQLLKSILRAGGIPLLGGDGVIADSTRIKIASADALAVVLARELSISRILFATDVDGVYATYPPHEGARPHAQLKREDISHVALGAQKGNKHDVTGAMGGKLSALLPLKHTTVIIFNGRTPTLLKKALAGKVVGTTIVL